MVSVTAVDELEVSTVPVEFIHCTRLAVPLLSIQLMLTASPLEYIAKRVSPAKYEQTSNGSKLLT